MRQPEVLKCKQEAKRAEPPTLCTCQRPPSPGFQEENQCTRRPAFVLFTAASRLGRALSAASSASPGGYNQPTGSAELPSRPFYIQVILSGSVFEESARGHCRHAPFRRACRVCWRSVSEITRFPGNTDPADGSPTPGLGRRTQRLPGSPAAWPPGQERGPVLQQPPACGDGLGATPCPARLQRL